MLKPIKKSSTETVKEKMKDDYFKSSQYKYVFMEHYKKMFQQFSDELYSDKVIGYTLKYVEKFLKDKPVEKIIPVKILVEIFPSDWVELMSEDIKDISKFLKENKTEDDSFLTPLLFWLKMKEDRPELYSKLKSSTPYNRLALYPNNRFYQYLPIIFTCAIKATYGYIYNESYTQFETYTHSHKWVFVEGTMTTSVRLNYDKTLDNVFMDKVKKTTPLNNILEITFKNAPPEEGSKQLIYFDVYDLVINILRSSPSKDFKDIVKYLEMCIQSLGGDVSKFKLENYNNNKDFMIVDMLLQRAIALFERIFKI